MTSKLLPMLRTDVAGKLVEWNDQLAELTGIPSREVLGEQFYGPAGRHWRAGGTGTSEPRALYYLSSI